MNEIDKRKPVTMRIALLPLLLLPACMPAEDADPTRPDPMAQASCGADQVQALVGQPVDGIDTRALADVVRILPPNSAMTMDLRMDRLNIETDGTGLITRIWCG